MGKNKKAGAIYIELDGELTNITELDREEYEQFLEIMEKLRIAYNILINHKK